MADAFGGGLQCIGSRGSRETRALRVRQFGRASAFVMVAGVWFAGAACSSSASNTPGQASAGAAAIGGSPSTLATGSIIASNAGGTTRDSTGALGGSRQSGGVASNGGSGLKTGGTSALGAESSGGTAGTRATGGSWNGGTSSTTQATGGASSRAGASSSGGSSSTFITKPQSGGTSSGAGGTSALASGGKANAGTSSGGTHTGGTAAGGRSQVTATPGSTLVKVNPGVRYQTFEGWGTSLCWWANRLGRWSTDKRNKFLDLITNPTTGLGYNVFRFNIGGGENPAHTHMTQGRDMPGFQPSQGSWDWDADAAQTSVLAQLITTGQAVIVEAFSNSPPYWMTKSGCASGSSDGANNLKDDAYDAFAGYLTDVVKHYRDELGITFRTLEPMNEPNANWWKSNGSQEGCHFSASNQQQIIKAVGAQLKSKGLSETELSASDENSMDDAYGIMSGYDATTLGYLAQMNVHSYAGTRRKELKALATSKGKRLWQSESGPLSVELASNTDSALFMAGRIITDLRELQPAAWIDWQVVDTSTNWTSFSINDAQQTGTPVKRFYMHANFSRYIRPGAVFVEVDDANMVAALAADGSSLTLVVRNGDTAKAASYTFDLTALASVGSNVEVYRTSASEDLVHLSPIAVQNWAFTATIPAYSVSTYVLSLAH